MSIKLGEICNFQSGGTPSKNNSEFFDGTIPWVTTTALNGSKIDERNAATWITEKAIKESAAKIVPANSIMVGTRVGVGKVAVNTVEMSTSQDIISLIDINEERWDKDYLCKFLQSKSDYLNSQARGATIKGIKINVLAELAVPDISVKEQCRISEVLNTVTKLINARQQQLAKLDELVKARFVEMFGDPVLNPYGFEKVPLSELAEIKIGPFGSLLHKEDYIEGGHPLLNPSHIVDGNIVPDKKLTISDEKYNELEAYHLHFGDVVMGRRGEMGRCAVVMGEGFLCGTGSLLIRTRGEVTADFIQKVISFPSFKKTIEDMAVGQTMPNLNVPIVSRFQVVKPPVKVQHRYYSFIGEVDNLRQQVQKSIEKLKTLKGALMQQYFG